MTNFDYSEKEYLIREDFSQAYNDVWERIAAPGNWWTGQDRVAIAAEVRAAQDCPLCKERKAALSPFSTKGSHTVCTNLPDVAIDAVHRVVTDVSRLTESWLSECVEKGLSHEQYIELLGIVVGVVSIDAFHRALGFELEPLPEPISGEPDRYRPETARKGDAWIATISAGRANDKERDLYDGMPQTGNVVSAMSLVPNSVRILKTLASVQYLDTKDVINPSKNGNRKISRAQMEMLAGRVSALSSCFY
jgi:hypothetical protein